MSERAWTDDDKRYLRLACRLALKAAGRTSPNPTVGAVLVRGKKIIATGFHRFAGGDHAEIVALKRAGSKAKGATLYINLEPCSHHGRTPPCVDSVIRAGIKEVVAGMRDPNPLVAGKGIRQLRRAGIRVRVGLLREECEKLNEAFVKYITRGIPFVTLKLAATLDGKIAAITGDARWISNAESRLMVHGMRNRVDAVIVGSGTAIADDPQLTARIPGGRNPCRVILDSRLRVSPNAKVFRQGDPEKTIVATGDRVALKKIRQFEERHAKVWRFALRQGRISWTDLLKKLADMGLTSVMIEGGAMVAASALKEKVVDKLVIFYAPKILGGDGLPMIDSLCIERVRDAISVKNLEVKKSGVDFMVSGYL